MSWVRARASRGVCQSIGSWCSRSSLSRSPYKTTDRFRVYTAGLITLDPLKRPRWPDIRFEAAQPNETWQSDFTRWHPAGNTDVEILNCLDDHSRFLLSYTAHHPVTGPIYTFWPLTRLHPRPHKKLPTKKRLNPQNVGSAVPDVLRHHNCGPRGTRTPDPLGVNEML